MQAVDLEQAVQDFLRIGRQFQATSPLTAERVLQEVISWYRGTRITSAKLDEDGDMLLLQWGASEPLKLSEPTDLRDSDPDAVTFADERLKYIDFTRQVVTSGESDTPGEEGMEFFDDAAVQMSISLFFDRADGSEKSGNLWVPQPDEAETGRSEFLGVDFIQGLLQTPAHSCVVKVGHCG